MAFGGIEDGLVGGIGSNETSTRATSCMLGLSEGILFVHSNASWNVFRTRLRSVQVTDTSESTASITVLLSALERI